MTGPKQAVVLLAGAGSRLGVYTERIPKCMVEVAEEPLLLRLLNQLEKLPTEEAILVVGFKADIIRDAVGNSYGNLAITYVENEEWETTNNVVSLALATDFLGKDFLLLEGDLFFVDGVLDRLLGHNQMAVDSFRHGMDGTVVTTASDNLVEKFYLKTTPNRPEDISKLYKTVNAYSFSFDSFLDKVLPRLNRLLQKGERNVYYEQAIADAVDGGSLTLKYVKFDEGEWCEIDTAEDLQQAWVKFGE